MAALKKGHAERQFRPLGLETGQYPTKAASMEQVMPLFPEPPNIGSLEGMTVNERLFSVGTHVRFYTAIDEGNRDEATALLLAVHLTPEEAAAIVSNAMSRRNSTKKLPKST